MKPKYGATGSDQGRTAVTSDQDMNGGVLDRERVSRATPRVRWYRWIQVVLTVVLLCVAIVLTVWLRKAQQITSRVENHMASQPHAGYAIGDLAGTPVTFHHNAEGVFSAVDATFAQIRLWQDRNRDGISQGSELSTLDSKGIVSIRVAGAASNVNLGNGNTMGITAAVKHHSVFLSFMNEFKHDFEFMNFVG